MALKISVICPVYNVEKYLEECLESLVKQTLKDVEIICINDGSTDNSLKILHQYANKDSRILVVDKANGGAASCRNLGMSLAKGEYLHFCDTDDVLEADMLENMYNKAKQSNADVVLCPAGIIHNNQKLKKTLGLKIKKLPANAFAPCDIANTLFQITNPSAWNKIFRRAFVLEKDLHFQDLKSCNDICFVYTALASASVIDYILKCGYWYRNDALGAISRNRHNFVNCIYEAAKSIQQFLIEHDLMGLYAKSFCRKVASSFRWELSLITDNVEYVQLLEKFKNFLPKKYHHKLFKHKFLYLLDSMNSFLQNNAKFLYYWLFKQKFPSIKTVGINIPCFSKDRAGWGDYWLASDLRYVLSHQFCAFLNYKDEYNKAHNRFNDVTITIAGMHRKIWKPISGKINIIYLISHPDEYVDLQKDISLTLCCSEKFSKHLNQLGIKSVYVPQFTDKSRFYPQHSTNEKYKHKLLFVGNSRSVYRDCVKYAIENNLPLSLFGNAWQSFPVQKYLKGGIISNNELYLYYSNSDIILNDHHKDMKEKGFISNRVYDVTACKGFLISDYMPEIEAVYGDSIPMYKNEKEFVSLVKYYLSHPKERQEKAQKAHEITLKNFTSEKIGKIFVEEINKLWSSK